MSPLKRLGILVSGSRFMQRRLAKHVRFCHHLMGIGSGDRPEASGEKRIFDVLRRRSEGPWCILDVGANRGQFLRCALESMPRDRTQVHCFEPGALAFSELERSFGSLAHVRLNRTAVGRTIGRATLHYECAGSGLASLTKRDLVHFGIHFDLSESVELTTLDDYCARSAIERVHLLKLDIEGHELDALKGSHRLLAERRVDALTFEFGGTHIDTRTCFRDFWKLLGAAQMRIHRITPSGYWFPIERYEESLEQYTTTNYLALRQD